MQDDDLRDEDELKENSFEEAGLIEEDEDLPDDVLGVEDPLIKEIEAPESEDLSEDEDEDDADDLDDGYSDFNDL